MIRRVATEALIVLIAVVLIAWAWVADPGWYEQHVVPARCLTGGTAPWQIVRGLAFLVAAGLGLIVRPWLGRAVARAPGLELLGTIAGIVVAFVAALGAGELVLRRVQWDDVLTNPDVVETQPDRRLGWVLRPNRDVELASDSPDHRKVRYTIDADGDRVPDPGATIDRAAPTLVIAGESIAFGHALQWDETFGAVVGKALGLQVLNLGAPAYGTDQAYQRLGDALENLAQPKVVVIVFVPLQIRRNISPARPRLTLGLEGDLDWIPPATGLDAWRLARLVADEPYHDDEALELTRAILLAGARIVRAHGARPLFLITNYGPPCRDPDSPMLARLFRDLPHIRVDIETDDRIGPEDPHPSPKGARKIAAALLNALR